MKSYLIDSYRSKGKVVLWIKTPDDIRIEKDFVPKIYLGCSGERLLRLKDIEYKKINKKTYYGRDKAVLELTPPVNGYERFIRDIEHLTKHRVPLFDADIKPEQMYLYENDLRPFSCIEVIDNKIIPIETDQEIALKSSNLKIFGNEKIEKIIIDSKIIEGDEFNILNKFNKLFKSKDPDIIVADNAFSKIPLLYERLKYHGFNCPLDRWDPHEIKYRGGRSFWSYGQVRYKDYAVQLHGRLLVDTNTFVGTECEPDAIIELSQLSGTLFQQTASRSFGAAFQTGLVREMYRRGYLVPYKEKPIENPLSMLDMLKADRAGHTLDPEPGFHADVAEIDFTSMFPWLIYNHNISAECILTNKGPFASIPDVPIKVSMHSKGLVPTALKPFIDRRMYYKKNPTAVNLERAKGLKWVLVSCYGYLRFREFKLGIPSSHMAICAFARETILKVVELAEEKGFEVIHGIVDSIFIKKKGITEKEVIEFCSEVECLTGIPVELEGIFKWIVFLTSINDKDRALPSTYYGVFHNKDIKARGIEVRQRSVPRIVAEFQRNAIDMISGFDSEKEIRRALPVLCRYLRELVFNIPYLDKDLLTVNIRIAKDNYKHNIPQKIIVDRLKKKGIVIHPGEFISYVHDKSGVVLPEEFHMPDVDHYRKLLIRSLFVIMQPFGYSLADIEYLCMNSRQTLIAEYCFLGQDLTNDIQTITDLQLLEKIT